MKLAILPDKEYWALRKPLDSYIPEEEATEEFWTTFDVAQGKLRAHLARFGTEDEAWELPGHDQRCRVLYAYLYADALYTPELLPAIAALLPKDGKAWCAELECYSDAVLLPNGNSKYFGVAVLVGDTVCLSEGHPDLVGYAVRLGFRDDS